MAGDQEILEDIATYYGGKLAEHGLSHRGVDWSTAESQLLRFEQLARVFEGDRGFSVIDYGCGYGAMVDFLERRRVECDYRGFDIVEEMVQVARQRYGKGTSTHVRARFVGPGEKLEEADYVLASGILNVRLRHSESEWGRYVERTIDELDRLARKGYAFNALTAYADREHMREDLFYADPKELFDRLVRRHPRRVALLHDYGLYEFTILVRKAA